MGAKIEHFKHPNKSFIILKRFYLSGDIEYKIDCEMDKIILKKTAIQKVSTSKPPTISVQSIIISALITSKNSPKVSNVMGNVNKISNGFTKRLSSPNTTATIKEVEKLSTLTPGMKCAMITTRMAVRRIRKIRFILYVLGYLKSNYDFKKRAVRSKKARGFSACNQCPTFGMVSINAVGKCLAIPTKSSSLI